MEKKSEKSGAFKKFGERLKEVGNNFGSVLFKTISTEGQSQQSKNGSAQKLLVNIPFNEDDSAKSPPSKIESKEKHEKSLELEDHTFRIDTNGWTEEIADMYIGKKINIKINSTKDVIEYLEGPQRGEQIFITYAAFIREVCKDKNCTQEEAEKRYLMTGAEYRKKMKAIIKAGTYPDFYDKEIQPHLAGAYHPHGKKFYNVGQRSYIWLVGGDNMIFTKDGPDFEPNHSDFGFSGRLLKSTI